MIHLNKAELLITFIFSVVTVLVVLPPLGRVAYTADLLDYPNARKIHRKPMPLTGGIGMLLALVLYSILFLPLDGFKGFYVGMIILTATGLMDDLREINHKWKFAAQILASIIIVYLNEATLASFGNLIGLGPVTLGIAALPMTIFCVVGVTNAINMIDGLDGLAGGVALISFLSLAFLSFISQQSTLMLISLGLSGAVLGFLIYNWNPARLFMGDAGSLPLGFSMAYLSIAITQKAGSSIPPVAPLLILTVPIVDTLTVMLKRILKGKSPFAADKSHLHHILLRFGINKKNAVFIILAMNAVFSVITIAGVFFRIPDYKLFLMFIIYFISYVTLSFYIKKLFILKKLLSKKLI